MTIQNIYFFGAYSLWIYILLGFMLKLTADRLRNFRFSRRKWQIRRFFEPGGAAHKRFDRILKGTEKDFSLFLYACRTYTLNRSGYSPEEVSGYAGYIRRIFRDRKGSTEEETVAIRRMAAQCGVAGETKKEEKKQTVPV